MNLQPENNLLILTNLIEDKYENNRPYQYP